MSENNEYSVMAATRAFIRTDQKTIEVQLATTDGRLNLLMTPTTLGQIVSAPNELETAVQTQAAATTGHAATQASEVSAVRVDATAAGEKLVISFRNSKGRIPAFALSLEQTQRLRVDLKKAEAKAKELASKPRN